VSGDENKLSVTVQIDVCTLCLDYHVSFRATAFYRRSITK